MTDTPQTAVDGTPASELLTPGPGICVHCITGFELPGTPTGRMEKIGAYETYIASPPEGAPVRDDIALAFFPDAFGFSLKNNKVLPDMFAAKLGCRVYVPDYFEGSPCPEFLVEGTPPTAEAVRSASLFEYLKFGLKVAAVVPWFFRHRHSLTIPKVAEWIGTIKETRGVQKIGTVGYCYGGKMSLAINGKGIVDASVSCHPTLATKADIENVQKPILLLCAEEDPIFPLSAQDQAKEIIGKREDLDFNLIMYPNTVHGFAVRPDLSIPQIKEAFESAFGETVSWFNKHVSGAK